MKLFLKILLIFVIIFQAVLCSNEKEPIVNNSIVNFTEKDVDGEHLILIEGKYPLEFEFREWLNELHLTLTNTSLFPEVHIELSKYIRKYELTTDKEKGLPVLKFVFDLSRLSFYEVRLINYEKIISVTFRDSFPRALFNKTIVIDPGHGAFSEYGYDCGAIGYTGLLESKVNLKIALKLKELLEGRGAKVILTRDKESYLYTPLYEQRMRIINDSKGDLFVSIHQNFAPENRNIRGTEVYYCREEFENLALIMLTNFCKTTGIPQRRICYEERDIIKEVAQTPAIVFECVFMSNPEDEAFLYKDNNLEIMAYGIQNGIIKYFEND